MDKAKFMYEQSRLEVYKWFVDKSMCFLRYPHENCYYTYVMWIRFLLSTVPAESDRHIYRRKF